MPRDIDIAQACTLRPIQQIAEQAGIPQEALSPYGKWIAKVDARQLQSDAHGHLILVTAINPTPAGEGKTTVSVGLADGMRRTGRKAMLALREPSLGPVFGMKGGATGGGYAQVLPMENINLHFTGDLHAITAANNLLAAMVDNHVQQGNALGIDPRRISWRRCLDVNDRQLRQIVSGLGGKMNGMPREDGFDITAASEVMAVFCLADSLTDLKKRLARLVVARTFADQPVTAGDLHAEGAMAALLADALQPNLIQTIEGTPCLMHGGPFANIAHGCNSVIATRTALRLSDWVVTEAGFGADLGAEKFLDIKCRQAGLWPETVVLVATIRALKHHGGCPKDALNSENLEALQAGLSNLKQHARNLKDVYGVPVVVAINHFVSDTEAEIALLREACEAERVPVAFCDAWAKGGEGATELADLVCSTVEANTGAMPQFCYPDDAPLAEKIKAIGSRIYHAKDVAFGAGVLQQLARFEQEGWGNAPVCIAKTQYSFSDNAKLLGAPQDYTLTIRQVRLSAGAGFVVAFAGDIIAMPGLPKAPAALQIDVDENGRIPACSDPEEAKRMIRRTLALLAALVLALGAAAADGPGYTYHATGKGASYQSESLTYEIEMGMLSGTKVYVIRLWMQEPGKQILKAAAPWHERIYKAESLAGKLKKAALIVNASGFVSPLYPWIPETYPGTSEDYYYTPLGSLTITNGELYRNLEGVPYTGLTLEADGLHMYIAEDNETVLAHEPTQTWSFYEKCPLILDGESILDRDWDFAKRKAIRTIIASLDANNFVLLIVTSLHGLPLAVCTDFLLGEFRPDWAFNLDGGPSTAFFRRLKGKKTAKLIYGAGQRIVDVMGFAELEK